MLLNSDRFQILRTCIYIHTLTQAARSYVLLVFVYACTCVKKTKKNKQTKKEQKGGLSEVKMYTVEC